MNIRKYNDKFTLSGLLIIWLIITQIGYMSLGVFNSDYFSFGPSERLKFINAPIDTWFKWVVLASFRLIGTVAEVASGDMIGPWITTTIQDEHKKTLPFPAWKCKMIVQMFYFYHDFNSMFSVFLALTQVDMALIVIICQSTVVQFWTLPQWLDGKVYISKDFNKLDKIDKDSIENLV